MPYPPAHGMDEMVDVQGPMEERPAGFSPDAVPEGPGELVPLQSHRPGHLL